jgi:hypothetical protein
LPTVSVAILVLDVASIVKFLMRSLRKPAARWAQRHRWRGKPDIP